MPAPRTYLDELRERAVRLMFESGRPIAHVAADFGVHKESLRHWVRQTHAGARKDMLRTSERERLKQLERENRELRKANEILKSASVFSPGARRDPAEVSAFVDQERGRFVVGLICRTLGVSPSAYYQRSSARPRTSAGRDRPWTRPAPACSCFP